MVRKNFPSFGNLIYLIIDVLPLLQFSHLKSDKTLMTTYLSKYYTFYLFYCP